MTTLNKTGRPAYMYEESTQTWYQVSGLVSTGANYQWVGTHQFDNNTTFVGPVNIVKKFNSFLNATARAAAISSPEIGLITFIQQDGGGATINRFEYWDGTAWIPYADPATTVTLTGTQTLTNKIISGGTVDSTYLISPGEKVVVLGTSVTGTINFDCKTQAIVYYTSNASANWTINFRGDGSTTLNNYMLTNESLSVLFLVTQGSPAYYPTAFQIDGVSVTPKWSGGVAPLFGNTNSIDAYSFSIVKTATSTYTVFASQGRFA